MSPGKLFVVRARVSIQMKRDIARLAAVRGEAEAVLIREAIKAYIEKHRSVQDQPPTDHKH
jgi:predicted DNA-binding protein